jgi:hypothetical protein
MNRRKTNCLSNQWSGEERALVVNKNTNRRKKVFPTLKSFSGAHATVASGFGFVVGKIEKLFDLIWPRAEVVFPRERDESERKWSNFAVRRSNFQLHSAGLRLRDPTSDFTAAAD